MSDTRFFCIPSVWIPLPLSVCLIMQTYFLSPTSFFICNSQCVLIYSVCVFVCLFVWVKRSHFPSLILWSWDFLQASPGFIALQQATTVLIHLFLKDQNLAHTFCMNYDFLRGYKMFWYASLYPIWCRNVCFVHVLMFPRQWNVELELGFLGRWPYWVILASDREDVIL